MTSNQKKFGFVVPRCGKGIGGGVETLFAELARHLQMRGDKVEIFTTCARDNRTWENSYKPGTVVEDELTIHRFSVDPRNLDVWVPLQIRLSEGMLLSVDEQLEWMAQGVNSTGLYSALAQRANEFDNFFFGPYLFSTTFFGSLIAPEKSILIPCLHDESYAYLDVVRSMFRQVQGCMFNAAPEQDLARRLYGSIPGGEVGMGFYSHAPEYVSIVDPYFSDRFPYVLYVGRKETGKNAQVLIDHFLALRKAGHLEGTKLVIAGAGSFDDLHRPEAKMHADIIDIGHLSEHDKHRLIKHATVLCQPSTNESFSIVLMEAWLLGTPVLVHAGCAVTRQHVIESGGGLYFADTKDFLGAVQTLVKEQTLQRELAQAGLSYTQRKYSWDAVLKRFDAVLENIATGGERFSSFVS